MKKALIIAGIIQLLYISVLPGQDESEQGESVSIMFWNVENLFDPFDDSLTRDEEFTPAGIYAWTWNRFNHKLNNIYKVIMSASWKPPDVIGLCEVENRWVLERLTYMTPLSKFEYRIIHKDSPDLRGIDVALLYLPDYFKPINKLFIHVTGLKDSDGPARDILWVKGVIKPADTVNIIVNHWPSRYPGQGETMHKRTAAALTLKRLTDSLLISDPLSRIIIMGDFNDEPQDPSISETLGASLPGTESGIPAPSLYCLIPDLTTRLPGTLKFQGRWYLFDQFIVSAGLLHNTSSHKLISHKSLILDHDFLFEPDEAYTGRKAYRTYTGYLYKGGYSDHLPIILDLRFADTNK
jgi:hypothetical protein